MSKLVPAGFGAPLGRARSSTRCTPCQGGAAHLVERVLEELIAQTRLDEALACNRAIAPALGLDARIAEHRKDLRKAQRRAK